ncbi:MAG: TauD/TfdA family dioxygenase [Streptosporangiaceae bacterium]
MRAIDGVFREQPTDAHVRCRHHLLAGGAPLSPPPVEPITACSGEFPGTGAATVLEELDRRGLAVVRLDEPLPDDRFVAFGSMLGTPLPETDPGVQPFVRDSIVFNLMSRYNETEDTNLQPFATNYLTLHSEGSGRPVNEQPRFIVLMCCEPGAAASAHTVLVSMADVAEDLGAWTRQVLVNARYRRSRQGPPICRGRDGRVVFSFRDFAGSALEWTYTGERSAHEVNDAIRSLLSAMYQPNLAVGVRWERGMLVIIDNTYFFHGRTAGTAATATAARHLKRMRILGQD